MNFLRRFLTDSSGASAIEYGVGLALIALLVLTGMSFFGLRMAAMLDGIADKLG